MDLYLFFLTINFITIITRIINFIIAIIIFEILIITINFIFIKLSLFSFINFLVIIIIGLLFDF
jgi:hypothetical protein